MKPLARGAMSILRRGLLRAGLMGLALGLVVAGVALTARGGGSGLLPSGKAKVRKSGYGVTLPPVPVNDSFTVNEDSGTTDLDVHQNDVDPDSADYRIQGPDRFHTAHGTVHVPPGRKDVVYTPNPDFCGTGETFDYSYGGSSATVDITVSCVDDPPDFSHSGASTYVENSAPQQVSSTVKLRDEEHGHITGGSASVSTGYAAGQDKLTWVDNDPSDPITLDPSSDARHVFLTGTASAGRYRDALRGVHYENTSDAPSTTTRHIKFRATDDGNATGDGTAVLDVTAVNDAPTAHDDSFATSKDTALTVSDPAGGVLANDTDPDGDALTAVSYSDPAHGTLTHDPNGTFQYTPAAGYHGPDSFTYKAHDASTDSAQAATVAIEVADASQPPAASDDAATVAEDSGASTLDVLANDTAGTSVAKRVASATDPAHGTVAVTHSGADLAYTPDADYCNSQAGGVPDSFHYTLDGGSQATVTVTVTCVEDTPVATDDSGTTDEDTALDGNVLGNDHDADGDALTAAAETQPAHGTLALAADGSFTYTPAKDFNGSDSFTYRASDGQASSAAATVELTVRPVDDAPVAVDDSASVAQDSDPAHIEVLTNDTDVDGGPKRVTAASDPAHGQATVSGDGAGVDYLPDAGYCNSQSGGEPDTFTYTLNGGAVATVSLAVTCKPGPPPPAGSLAIKHPETGVRKSGTLVTLVCAGASGVRCKGTVTLEATKLKTRARKSEAAGASFSILAGRRRTVRLLLPAATLDQLAKRHKAVVRAVGQLSTGSKVTRLLTVYGRR